MKTTMLTTIALLAAAGLAHSAEPFALTKDNLGEVLTNMGLRPEKVNEKRYRMQTDRVGIKFTISASISNDGTEVWLNTYVVEIADIAKVPVDVVDKLMIASNDYGPSHFTFVAGEKPGARSVYLHRAVDNRGLNPAMIREAIDNLASDVVSTKPLWEAASR
jgi:hypothetical protein